MNPFKFMLLVFAVCAIMGAFFLIFAYVAYYYPEPNTLNPEPHGIGVITNSGDSAMRKRENKERCYHGRLVNGVHYAWYIQLSSPLAETNPRQPRYAIVYADARDSLYQYCFSIELDIMKQNKNGGYRERNLDKWVDKYLAQGGELYRQRQ